MHFESKSLIDLTRETAAVGKCCAVVTGGVPGYLFWIRDFFSNRCREKEYIVTVRGPHGSVLTPECLALSWHTKGQKRQR